MTTKQIKIFRIAALAIVVIYFAPSIAGILKHLVWPDMPAAAGRRIPITSPKPLQPVQPALVPASPADATAGTKTTPTAPNASGATISGASQDSFSGITDFRGKWTGSGMLDRRGMASMTIEIHEASGVYSAYSYLSCIPFLPSMPKMNPTVAVLTGKLEKGSLQFHVEKTLGGYVTEKTCQVSAVAITPFGDAQMAAEWSDSCGGGQLLLTKISARR